MVEMRVAALGLDARGDVPVLLLREEGPARRLLPVWVGLAEASAIELELHHVVTPRPTSHQLLAEILDATGHTLERVCVTRLDGGIFYAELVITPDVRVSARVSDAVALALHVRAPIHASDDVLDAAALPGTDVVGLTDPGADDPVPGTEEVEVERLRRFLDDATPDDFDL